MKQGSLLMSRTLPLTLKLKQKLIKINAALVVTVNSRPQTFGTCRFPANGKPMIPPFSGGRAEGGGEKTTKFYSTLGKHRDRIPTFIGNIIRAGLGAVGVTEI